MTKAEKAAQEAKKKRAAAARKRAKAKAAKEAEAAKAAAARKRALARARNAKKNPPARPVTNGVAAVGAAVGMVAVDRKTPSWVSWVAGGLSLVAGSVLAYRSDRYVVGGTALATAGGMTILHRAADMWGVKNNPPCTCHPESAIAAPRVRLMSLAPATAEATLEEALELDELAGVTGVDDYQFEAESFVSL